MLRAANMMPDTVCYQQTEYGIGYVPIDGEPEPLSPDRLVRLVAEELADYYPTLPGTQDEQALYFQNGGILSPAYSIEDEQRIPAHPAWCTPECRSPLELVRYDQAGDVILAQILPPLQSRLRNMGYPGTVILAKNNRDVFGHTFGCLEFYMLPEPFEKRQVEELIPFLATRQIICGTGTFSPTIGANQEWFQISQRADHIESVVREGTGKPRPIILLAEEAGSHQWFRVAIGDSNMSDYSAFLRIGITLLVAQAALVQGQSAGVKPLANPLEALRQVSRDLAFRTRLEMAGGQRETAIGIQRKYLELVRRSVKAGGWASQVLVEWARVLDALERDWSALRDRVDWVIKYTYMQQLLSRLGSLEQLLAWAPTVERVELHLHRRMVPLARDVRRFLEKQLPETEFAWIAQEMQNKELKWQDLPMARKLYLDLQEQDLAYHDLARERPRTGSFFHYCQRGLIQTLLSARDVEAAQNSPPPDSPRAAIRGLVVERASQLGRSDLRVGWDFVQIGTSQRVPLPSVFSEPVDAEAWLAAASLSSGAPVEEEKDTDDIVFLPDSEDGATKDLWALDDG